jgi:hypothetical protein
MSHLMNLCNQLTLGYMDADMISWGLPLLATNVKVFADHLESKFPGLNKFVHFTISKTCQITT